MGREQQPDLAYREADDRASRTCDGHCVTELGTRNISPGQSDEGN